MIDWQSKEAQDYLDRVRVLTVLPLIDDALITAGRAAELCHMKLMRFREVVLAIHREDEEIESEDDTDT